ncbi:SET domain-containing protein [Gymnopus androsaceus JB14]|uniref:SET domain-containing protein n=1 Tax=Gymnopus androsaceus JB14 TaxID=1447944 RepID=A0A6A4IA53_9AGAR|nr:SET domain-containing protein [Gymnopus androsaceus JB14]
MQRGFLNRSSATSANNHASASETIPSSQSGPRTRIISENPRIVQSDYDFPEGPYYLYVPHGENTSVIVDYLKSLIAISKWEVWNTDLPVIRNPAYELRTIEGKGMGMVATRRIAAGELLVNERPVYSQRTPLPRLSDYTDRNGHFYLGAVDGLSMKSKDKISSLKNSYGPDYHQLGGILKTNFLIHDITEIPDDAHVFSGVFPVISRANHDCSPNANYFFSFSTFSGGLRAITDIEIGEEITIMYTNLLEPRALRKASLEANYFFTCSCKACTADAVTARASDARRVQLSQMIRRLENGPRSSSPSLRELQDMLQAADTEGLGATYAQLLFYGSGRVMALGKTQLGMEWLQKAKKLYLNSEGEHSSIYKLICNIVH